MLIDTRSNKSTIRKPNISNTGTVRIGHQNRSPGKPDREPRIGHHETRIGHYQTRIGHHRNRIGDREIWIGRQCQSISTLVISTNPTRIGHRTLTLESQVCKPTEPIQPESVTRDQNANRKMRTIPIQPESVTGIQNLLKWELYQSNPNRSPDSNTGEPSMEPDRTNPTRIGHQRPKR